MEHPAIMNNLSWVPVRVQTRFQGKALGDATGFFYKSGDGLRFITNWHVVTGRHAETGLPLDTVNGSLPDSLRIRVPFHRQEADKPVKKMWWMNAEVPLYFDDQRKQPVWLEHAERGGAIDVAVLPGPPSQEHFGATAANDAEALGLNEAVLHPTLAVYVLGYPLGLTGGHDLPIFKRATIANEPEFDPDGLPKILIDTATRKGMSGAPVFVDQMGSWIMMQPDGTRVLQVAGRGRKFVGIYSARDGHSTEFEAQLGIVWKAHVIDEIIFKGKQGASSFWPSSDGPG